MNNILPISVLIPTMNRPESLERTLKKYMSAKFIPAQIVVVDQSVEKYVADKNKKVLDSIANEVDFQYVYQKEPSSTKARNIATEKANNEIIIYSDDDVDIYSDTFIIPGNGELEKEIKRKAMQYEIDVRILGFLEIFYNHGNNITICY